MCQVCQQSDITDQAGCVGALKLREGCWGAIKLLGSHGT